MKIQSFSTKYWSAILPQFQVFESDRDLGGTLYNVSIKSVVSNTTTEAETAVIDCYLLKLYHEKWENQHKYHLRK